MSKYHYRITKFSRPFEDDNQLKTMFWQAVAENLKATDNLNIWLESSKTDVATWKLLEGDTDYTLLIRDCEFTNIATHKELDLIARVANKIGASSSLVTYILECYKYSQPFVIVATEEGNFDNIYFMERVDKDQLTDMEYALSNLPEKQVETIKVGDTVTLVCWPNCYFGWPTMNEMIGSTGVVTAIGYSGESKISVEDQNCLLEVRIDSPIYLRQSVRWPVRHVSKVKEEVSDSATDEKAWY